MYPEYPEYPEKEFKSNNNINRIGRKKANFFAQSAPGKFAIARRICQVEAR